jgi:hypothetical protein
MPKSELLVEGRDEKFVITHLCRRHGIDASSAFSIVDVEAFSEVVQHGAGGVERLLAEIETRVKAAAHGDRLAIIVDADDDVATRWEQLRNRLTSEIDRRLVPSAPEAHGTIIDADDGVRTIRVGIWIMPDNLASGMLEDFLAALVPSERLPLLEKVDDFLNAAQALAEFPRAKARIHAYLAVQPDPGKPLGLALTFRFLAADSPYAQPFVDWLKRTLIEPF